MKSKSNIIIFIFSSEEFLNTDYIQEFALDGSKFEYKGDFFTYPFPLSSQQGFHKPQLDECFDINPAVSISHSISIEERNRRRIGSPICCAYNKNLLAIGLINPCSIYIWSGVTLE